MVHFFKKHKSGKKKLIKMYKNGSTKFQKSDWFKIKTVMTEEYNYIMPL